MRDYRDCEWPENPFEFIDDDETPRYQSWILDDYERGLRMDDDRDYHDRGEDYYHDRGEDY